MKPILLGALLASVLGACGWYLGLLAKGNLQGATLSAIAGLLGGAGMAASIWGLINRAIPPRA